MSRASLKLAQLHETSAEKKKEEQKDTSRVMVRPAILSTYSSYVLKVPFIFNYIVWNSGSCIAEPFNFISFLCKLFKHPHEPEHIHRNTRAISFCTFYALTKISCYTEFYDIRLFVSLALSIVPTNHDTFNRTCF